MTVQRIYENALNVKIYGNNASVSKYQKQLYEILQANVDEDLISKDEANYIIGTLNNARKFLGWQVLKEL